jgi:hypothetical protein
MRSIASAGPAIIRDVVVPPAPLIMDHPGWGIPSGYGEQ